MGSYYSLKGGIEIPPGADLNEYKTPGNYYCEADSTARSLQNCPISFAFTLKVNFSNGFAYPSQTITLYKTGIKYYRYFITERERLIWTEWNNIIINTDLSNYMHVETIRTSEITIPAYSGYYYNDSLSVQKQGYDLIGFLNGYPEGNASIIVHPNGWAYNPTETPLTIQLVTRWLFVKH